MTTKLLLISVINNDIGALSHDSLSIDYETQKGQIHLPKFKFGLILKLQIKKFKTCLNQMCKIHDHAPLLK